MIKITPAASATDRRVMTFNYVEAVKKLPCSFDPTEIDPIISRINPKLLGQIRSIFIVITDDQFKKKMPKASGAPEPSAGAQGGASGNDSESETAPEVSVAPVSTQASGSRSARGEKRGASPSASTAPAKK